MICKSCGSEFSEQLPFCPYCAAPRGEPAAKGASKVLTAASEGFAKVAAKAETQAKAASESFAKAAEKAEAQAKIAGENLAKVAEKAEIQAKVAGENLGKVAAKAEVQAKAARKGFSKVAAVVGRWLKAVGRSVANIAAKAKSKFDYAGGFSGIAAKVKRFFYVTAVKIKYIAGCVVQEFEDNHESPVFRAYVGVVVFLILIIILLLVTR